MRFFELDKIEHKSNNRGLWVFSAKLLWAKGFSKSMHPPANLPAQCTVGRSNRWLSFRPILNLWFYLPPVKIDSCR